MMKLLHTWNIGYQGASVATLITQIIPIIFLLIFIHKNLKVNYYSTIKSTIKITTASLIMLTILYLLTLIYPLDCITKGSALLQTIIYATLGIIIYIILAIKFGIIKDIFNNIAILKKIKNKFKRKNT